MIITPSCTTAEITGEVVAFEGFIMTSNDQVMGFKITDDSGNTYDLGVINNPTGTSSLGEEAINGAIVGLEFNQTGYFGFLGLRLEYHDYVHALES